MYGDVMMEIDFSVGQILKALKKHRLQDDTLVVFTSDNGPWLCFGNHAGSTGPLREGKGTMWEGGARVPCIMRWPGHIPAGTVCEKIAATIDLLPTIAAITQAKPPKKKIDGVNIQALLEGRKDVNPRDHYYYYYSDELRCIRQDRWKLHFPHEYRSYEGVEPGKDGFRSDYAKGTTELALYDLENDIGERNNVAEKYPQIVQRLKDLAQKIRQELGDSLTEHEGKEIRPEGKVPD